MNWQNRSDHKGCDKRRDIVKALSADSTVSSSASESVEASWLLPMTSISSALHRQTHITKDIQHTHSHTRPSVYLYVQPHRIKINKKAFTEFTPLWQHNLSQPGSSSANNNNSISSGGSRGVDEWDAFPTSIQQFLCPLKKRQSMVDSKTGTFLKILYCTMFGKLLQLEAIF